MLGMSEEDMAEVPDMELGKFKSQNDRREFFKRFMNVNGARSVRQDRIVLRPVFSVHSCGDAVLISIIVM